MSSEASSELAGLTRQDLDTFLQLTPMRSLQFIKHSTHWTESIFWIVLIAGATTLAIRDVRKVCDEFVNEETYTSMRVTGLQRLTFKDAIVCVEYNPLALDLSDPVLVHHAETPSVLNLSRGTNVTAVEFLEKSLKLLTAISVIENGRPLDYERKVADLQRSEDLQQWHDWLRMQNTNMSELSAIVGNWLCHAFRIEVNIVVRGALSSELNPCDPTKISWLGVIPFVSISTTEVAFCVDIGQTTFFDSMLDRVVISVGRNISRDFPGGDHYYLNSFLDFTGDPVSTDMTNDYIEFPTSGCTAFDVGKDAELRLLDRRIARCDQSAKTRLACLADCHVLRYESTKQCNCTQFAWLYLNASRTSCVDTLTVEQQLDCRRVAHSRSNITEACWRSCLFPCRHRQYAIDHSTEECHREALQGGIAIELTPKRFTVTVFEENSYTITELFSLIGGSCSLWLGVGGLGICHAVLFPLKLLKKFFYHSFSARQGSHI